MSHSVISSAEVTHHRCDPLDDLVVAVQTERYFKIRAALAFLLRGQSSPERVFKLYELPGSELDWFSDMHPQEAEAWLTAYIIKNYKAAYERLFCGYYFFCSSSKALSLSIPFCLL